MTTRNAPSSERVVKAVAAVTGDSIPVTVVGGYLGAGKTSLLNHILRESAGVRLAVLVNDFGALNIDAELIESQDGDTINLANGCICCSLAGGFGTALLGLRDRPMPPERVVIEASGVSDPFKVAQYAHLPGFRLDGVIVMVDAETVKKRVADRYVGRQVAQQLRSADLLVLNKADLVADEQLDRTKAWLRDLMPDVRILETSHGRAPIGLLLGGALSVAKSTDGDHASTGDDHNHDHDHDYQSWSLTEPRPLDGGVFRTIIAALNPDVLRGKGLLYLREDPSVQFVFQLVGRRWEVVPGAPWGNRTPQTQLVLIGLPGSLDGPALDDALRGRPHRPN